MATSWAGLETRLVVEGVGDVREHIPNLTAGGDQHYYDDNCDEGQDEGVFHHSLAPLANREQSSRVTEECCGHAGSWAGLLLMVSRPNNGHLPTTLLRVTGKELSLHLQ